MTREGYEDEGCSGNSPGKGMCLVEEFSKYFQLLLLDLPESLVEELAEGAGAANIAALAATTTRLVPTSTLDPIGV